MRLGRIFLALRDWGDFKVAIDRDSVDYKRMGSEFLYKNSTQKADIKHRTTDVVLGNYKLSRSNLALFYRKTAKSLLEFLPN